MVHTLTHTVTGNSFSNFFTDALRSHAQVQLLTWFVGATSGVAKS